MHVREGSVNGRPTWLHQRNRVAPQVRGRLCCGATVKYALFARRSIKFTEVGSRGSVPSTGTLDRTWDGCGRFAPRGSAGLQYPSVPELKRLRQMLASY